MNLIKELVKLKIFSDEYIKSVKDFIRTIVYAGDHSEKYVNASIRIYHWLSHQIQIQWNFVLRGRNGNIFKVTLLPVKYQKP